LNRGTFASSSNSLYHYDENGHETNAENCENYQVQRLKQAFKHIALRTFGL
jgi:hypothetical protein